MEQKEVKKTFEEFGNYVIEKAKSNLKKDGKNASGKLYDSLEFEFKEIIINSRKSIII